MLKSIVHDWDDTRCATLLGHCRRAIDPDGRLLIVEPVPPERIEHPGQMAGSLLGDLNMLLLTGGRERTEAQFRKLLAGAGFELTAAFATEGSDYSVIEARPTG